MNALRRTKIVATLGPATDSISTLERVISAGANVLRFNFSHGTAEEHINRAEIVRNIARENNKHVAILGDLQGPKIRISTFKNGKEFLNVGEKFILDINLPKGIGDKNKVGVDYKDLIDDINVDDILLIDDGRIRLNVLEKNSHEIITNVIVGGTISNNKGINKLGGGLSADALTEKDKNDILTAAKMNVDYLAVSFPRSADDLNLARKLINDAGCNAKIVAKVERAEVVATDEAIDDIIMASDVIMVARGDLGVEIGDYELAGVQKKLIKRARQLNKVVITATQMMESMINNSMPTRAEVLDVANAVLDGTDAVMLSAETAAGNYPIATVSTMNEVCQGAEKIPSINVSHHRLNRKFDTIEEATALSAMYTANHLDGVKGVIALTETGLTPLLMSRISSGLPIYALSNNEKTLSQASLYRGVIPLMFNEDYSDFEGKAVRLLISKGYLSTGDKAVITHSGRGFDCGSSNLCRIITVN